MKILRFLESGTQTSVEDLSVVPPAVVVGILGRVSRKVGHQRIWYDNCEPVFLILIFPISTNWQAYSTFYLGKVFVSIDLVMLRWEIIPTNSVRQGIYMYT